MDDYNYTLDFYNVAWTRAQPYLVGVLTGYVLWYTKGEKINIHWVRE